MKQLKCRVRPMRFLASATALAAIGVAASAGASSAAVTANTAAASPIKLGISVPLTGPVGSSCGPLNKATLAWFNYVNAHGGIGGRQISSDTRDDAYTAARAVVNTKAFVSEGVTAVVGQCGSLQQPAQAPLLKASGIPYLFPFGVVSNLYTPSYPGDFSLLPSYGDQLATAIQYAFKAHGPGTVALINTSNPDLPTLINEVSGAIKKGGGKLVANYTVPPGTADYSPYVLKMKSLKPDYIVLDQTPQDAARDVNAMATSQFSPKKYLLGDSTIALGTFLSAINPSLGKKVIATSATLAPVDAGKTQCAQVIKAAKLPLTGTTLWGCGSAQAVTAALQQAGKNVTPASLISTLNTWKNKQASQIFPPITFSKSQRIGINKVFMFGVKGGNFKTLATVPVQ